MSKQETPRDLQIVGLLTATLVAGTLFTEGGNFSGALRVFVFSLPTCALGLVIYRLWVRNEFKRPTSWPEWVLLYVIGTIIGGIVAIFFSALVD